MKTAVYPGSFDPITYGHLDIIKRAASMFDKVIVAVMCNSAKTPLFTLDERVKMIKESVTGIDNVVVESFSGLLIDIFFGTYIGFYALIYMYIGFVVGKLHAIFFTQNLAIPIVIISFADFVFGFICYVLMFLFRTKFDIGYYMMNIIIPELVYTAVIAIFFYPVILWMNNSIDERELRSAKKFV